VGVSIHAPARGATNRCYLAYDSMMFQSTHPRGVRRRHIVRVICVRLFQSTHPRGVRQRDKRVFQKALAVSIHAPARGATIRGIKTDIYRCRFNPRTREGCDVKDLEDPGVTLKVSIHAPARGATLNRVRRYNDNFLFQSTHPRGVRLVGAQFGVIDVRVSIHAPARGATRQPRLLQRIRRSFNPRTREGCDYNYDPLYRPNYCFNPRTREGCDLNFGRSRANCSTFQSTHPRGVRQSG